ncbi:transcriptional regulator Medusa [Drepanopeziza brunnea f. sp. 'multigermtubi' MB_m1]|uniref:Transcriptional regulator Medusa n=1 Tax=Marssonina brunnea f. sp. multigermtubi (strain MB_m1) TaxID=1072389 RepID=K1WTR8_MARBU|nr:transcriptional regulator Medusa [Drepanopeziza brunnea f. sp. 'multigermtubi' MB_m1]EKD21035.1 transcriptional regulator Medusa [Drepanopeziza brunnea f. sp. 'multigermtubi' MB_m1]
MHTTYTTTTCYYYHSAAAAAAAAADLPVQHSPITLFSSFSFPRRNSQLARRPLVDLTVEREITPRSGSLPVGRESDIPHGDALFGDGQPLYTLGLLGTCHCHRDKSAWPISSTFHGRRRQDRIPPITHPTCVRSAPVIIDDSYASPETAAFHEEGYEGALVARVSSPRDLLPMSAYGKAQPPQLHGYDAGRGYSDNTFPYTAPSYGSQPPAPAPTAAPLYQHAPQLTPVAYPPNQVRTPYDEQTGPYLNVGVSTPEITSYSPRRGTRDTKFSVYISSLYELMSEDSTPHFFLMFGNVKCQAALQKLTQQGAVCSYSVTTEVPSYSATGWTSSAAVPISMWMESGDGDLIGKLEVGDFTFVDGLSATSGSQENSRKRKLSIDSTGLMRSSSKRVSNHQLRPKEEYGTYGYAQSETPPSYSPYLQSSSNYNHLVPPYHRSTGSYQGPPPQQQHQQQQQQPRHLAYGYQSSTTASPPTIKEQSPQASSWYPSGPTAPRSQGAQSHLGPSRPALSLLPTSQTTPTLIRTSTIQQTPSPATTPHGGAHFSSYGGLMYPHKAKLEIHGNLDDMTTGWSDDEWESRRRLVHFRQAQSGSTITVTFTPVTPEDRPQSTPTSGTISCIYWEEKNECFVTSVDTICLLEKLLNSQFSVEEKNRIRRNLEGFHPMTVSKGKADSEEFFKVIMAFPAPKPRNIEKDVKVFHWKDLLLTFAQSASPASILPPALTPVSSSTGYGTEGSSTGYGGISPRSMANSTTSTYTSNLPARVVSPHEHKSLMLHGGPPDLRVGISPHGPEASSGWPGGPPHQLPAHSSYAPLGHQPPPRDAWGMYLENSPATAASQPGSGFGGRRSDGAASVVESGVESVVVAAAAAAAAAAVAATTPTTTTFTWSADAAYVRDSCRLEIGDEGRGLAWPGLGWPEPDPGRRSSPHMRYASTHLASTRLTWTRLASTHRPVHPSIYPSIDPSIDPSIHPSTHPLIHPSHLTLSLLSDLPHIIT